MTLACCFAASLLGGFLFPWWWPSLAAYVLGFFLPRSGLAAFASGFLGTAAAWAGVAAFQDWRNHYLLSARMAQLFHLPSDWGVLALTGLIGGLMGGLPAWAGFALRAYIRPRRAAAEPAAAADAA